MNKRVLKTNYILKIEITKYTFKRRSKTTRRYVFKNLKHLFLFTSPVEVAVVSCPSSVMHNGA